MKYALFFYRANGEPGRTEDRLLQAHVARIEAQVTTEGRGRSPGRPEVAIFADVHNSAVVSFSVSQSIKEDCIACFPTISVEVVSFCEATTNIELTTVRGVVTI